MPHGDLVTACSDGVARIFSKASERQAPAEAVAAFHASIEDRKQQAKQSELSNPLTACASSFAVLQQQEAWCTRKAWLLFGAAFPAQRGCRSLTSRLVVIVEALQQVPQVCTADDHSCPVGPLHMCTCAAAAANEGLPPGLNVEEPPVLAQPGRDGQMKFIRESTGVNYYSWSSQT